MNGISVLKKRTQQSSLTPSALWGHSEERAVYEAGNSLSPDTQSVAP